MDPKTKKRVETLIQKSRALLSDSNREAAFEERDAILDSAHPQGQTKFVQSFANIKVYNIHQQCKSLILEINKMISTLPERLSPDSALKNELEILIAKLISEEKKYRILAVELRAHIRSIAKLDINAIKAQAILIIEKYKNEINSDSYAPHADTWEVLEKNLELINNVHALRSKKHATNQISRLLNPNKKVFCRTISTDYNLRIHDGELGHIAFARLFSVKSNDPHYSRALKTIDVAKNPSFPILSIFEFNEDELISEVMKLLLHIELYPGNKNVWLGTGTDVVARKKKYPGKGIYLNCDNKNFSWGLNRAYMKIAGNLGYDLVFIQRQFPNIQKAILSENPASLLIELVRESRPGLEGGSMYHHEDVPTYTAFEILALLEMGFKPNLDAEKFICMRLNMFPIAKLKKPLLMSVTGARPKRSHSAEPTYSMERDDRSPKEVKRIFEIPKTSQEKDLSIAIDRERAKAYFCPDEEMANEVDEVPFDLHAKKKQATELREKMSAIIDKQGHSLKTHQPQLLKSLKLQYGELGKIDSLILNIKDSKDHGSSKKEIDRLVNNITKIISDAEKAIDISQKFSTILHMRKLNMLNNKCNEALDKVNLILTTLDENSENLVKLDPSLRDLPTALSQHKQKIKFDTVQAQAIIKMEKKLSGIVLSLAKEARDAPITRSKTM